MQIWHHLLGATLRGKSTYLNHSTFCCLPNDVTKLPAQIPYKFINARRTPFIVCHAHCIGFMMNGFCEIYFVEGSHSPFVNGDGENVEYSVGKSKIQLCAEWRCSFH